MAHNTTILAGTTSGVSVSGGNPNVFSANADNATVDAAQIATALNGGVSVSVNTGSTGAQVGDLTVSAAVNKTAGGNATLQLTAGYNITVDQQIVGTAGALGIFLTSNAMGGPNAAIAINAALGSNGGAISITNNSFGLLNGIALNADVNAGAGNLSLTAIGGPIAQTAGAITADTLSISSARSVALTQSNNAIAKLGSIFAFQGINIVDGSGGLTVGGSVTANTGTLSLSTTGDLTTNSSGTLGGAAGVVLGATGAMTIGAEIFSASGSILLLARSGVTFSGTNAGAYAVTIVDADGDDNGTGSFTVDATGARFFGPSAVNVTAADVVLNGNLQATTVVLQPSQTTATIGVGGTGSFALSAAEFGKFAQGAGVTIGAASNTGGITVGATEATSAADTSITLLTGGAISVDATRGLSAANLTLAADSMALNGGALAATGTVTLRPVTPGTLISLGGADAVGTLGLTNAELATVAPSTALVHIGSNIAGNITISNAISLENDTFLETAGSISQAAGGTITLATTLGAPSNLTVGAAGPSVFSAAIAGSGQLFQSGGGTLTLAAANTYTGGTTVAFGATLLVNGSVASATEVFSGATLGGTGSTAAVTVSAGGTLSPGASAGRLSTGNVSLIAGSTFKVELGGTNVGSQYDQLDVTGSVALSGANLNLSLIGGFNPVAGNSFTIINNDGTDSVSGQFAGLSEGTTFAAGGKSFSITYHGGSNNNDVVLTTVTPANQPPVNSIAASKSVEANVGSAIVASVSDADALSGQVTTTLSVGHGTLAAAAVGGASVSGSGSTAIVITGTVSQVNAALAANNVIYTPTHDFFGADTLTMTTNDNGNSGLGGPKTDTDQMTLNVGTIATDVPGRDSMITATPGTFLLDGRDGIDRVIFNFRLVDAQVSYSGNKIIVDAPGYHTVMVGIERFTFTDGTVDNADSDPLVDDLFYYSHNQDVWAAHADADAHYHASGWHEGRDPNAFFSTSFYLSTNQDVKGSGADPLRHFDQGGFKEGRIPSPAFDLAPYLAANPDIKAAGLDPLAHFLQQGASEGRQPFTATKMIGPGGFDYIYYLQHNPDVAASGADPLQHFRNFGWKEGRDPNAYFDVNGYLANYADVKAAGINPLDHYNNFGWHEGRDPSTAFDTTSYRDAYPDIAAANVNPLLHFLLNGINEGRLPFGDGVWG